MGRVRAYVSPGALLLFALLWFFDEDGLVPAALPAVLAHELGHLLPLLMCGVHLRRVTVTAFGVELDYRGALRGAKALVCIGGGPLLGLVYAAVVCAVRAEFWRMSGALSFLLSVYNLLPVLPLDGGRLLAALAGEGTARRVSQIAAPLLLVLGGWALLRWGALPALLAGAWLTIRAFRD